MYWGGQGLLRAERSVPIQQKKERETEKFVLALCEWSATQCQHESERSVALIECLSFSSCAQVRARGNELRHGKTSLGGVIWRFVCSLTLSVVCNADKFACSTSRYARRKVRQTMEIKHTHIYICILITWPTSWANILLYYIIYFNTLYYIVLYIIYCMVF